MTLNVISETNTLGSAQYLKLHQASHTEILEYVEPSYLIYCILPTLVRCCGRRDTNVIVEVPVHFAFRLLVFSSCYLDLLFEEGSISYPRYKNRIARVSSCC